MTIYFRRHCTIYRHIRVVFSFEVLNLNIRDFLKKSQCSICYYPNFRKSIDLPPKNSDKNLVYIVAFSF